MEKLEQIAKEVTKLKRRKSDTSVDGGEANKEKERLSW